MSAQTTEPHPPGSYVVSSSPGALDRRLQRDASHPVAVAFSGGPDSYLALRRTLRTTSRPVVALHVDHGLNPLSAEWARRAEELACDLGADFRLLPWDGTKPSTGLPAAARAARHRLLANAARDAGAKVIVTGHTADDALENALMGQGELAEWSPSPVWPQGRGLMLLRPLLAERRRAIRGELARQGLLDGLVDDPSNADATHPRIAARARVAALQATRVSPDPTPFPFETLPGGAIRLLKDQLTCRALALAMTSVGGGERLPRGAEVERLLERGYGSLAGAKLIDDGETVLVVRNAGEITRGGLQPLPLSADESGVFDGRMEITATAKLEIRALKGHAAKLSRPEREAMAKVPAQIRPALPISVMPEGISCPILFPDARVTVHDLVAARLAQACGAIAHEAGL